MAMYSLLLIQITYILLVHFLQKTLINTNIVTNKDSRVTEI